MNRFEVTVKRFNDSGRVVQVVTYTFYTSFSQSRQKQYNNLSELINDRQFHLLCGHKYAIVECKEADFVRLLVKK